MVKALAIGVLLAASLAAAGSPGEARPLDCPANLANELASTGSARQLVTVVAATRRSTTASFRLWRKYGECWIAVDGPWTAHVGARGVSENKREADKTTPNARSASRLFTRPSSLGRLGAIFVKAS